MISDFAYGVVAEFVPGCEWGFPGIRGTIQTRPSMEDVATWM